MKKPWLRVAKVLAAAVIVGLVGRRFYLDLRQLDPETLAIRPGWLMASGLWYLAGLGCSGMFWYKLLWLLDQRPSIRATLRAYYIGHLGKYVPGKAWALLLRSGLICGPRVHVGVAALTAFYEVLTTMASGALVAACIFSCQPPQVSGLTWSPVLSGFLLLGLVGEPLLPAIFNRLIRRLARRLQSLDATPQPRVRNRTLAGGLLLTSLGWVFLGAGLWAVLQGVLREPPILTFAVAAQCVGALALAYVAGFLAIVVPGGVGVREYVLLQLLGSLGPETEIAVAVLVLRLVWTGAEVTAAALLYFLPHPSPT